MLTRVGERLPDLLAREHAHVRGGVQRHLGIGDLRIELTDHVEHLRHLPHHAVGVLADLPDDPGHDTPPRFCADQPAGAQTSGGDLLGSVGDRTVRWTFSSGA